MIKNYYHIKNMKDCIIIGAGLSGLATAYFLKKQGIKATILEAQPRYGGRIKTIYSPDGQTPMEMGATWFGSQHQHLMPFLEELGVAYFPQFTRGIALFETMSFAPPQQFEIPASEAPYFRIKNGTETVIKALVHAIGTANIVLNETIERIENTGDSVILKGKNTVYEAKKVVLAAPLKVLLHHIHFAPQLPDALTQVMHTTQTWMAESIKFVVEYPAPFWKEKGFSGTIYSQVGVITEMYDHSNYAENGFSLMGFLQGSATQYSKEEREKMVVNQLIKLLGTAASEYCFYQDSCWANEPMTHVASNDFIRPHQNNGHPLLAKNLWENKLFFAGTETANVYGGYMDGAIYAAKRVANELK
jgi:monoamine oxidase